MAKDAEALIDAALGAARAGDWMVFGAEFAALRDACAPLIAQHQELREQFETLGVAAPQYDPDGCVAAFEVLAALLRGRHADALHAWQPQSTDEPLDLRGLRPPEPIVRILEALECAPREPLRAILPHEPVPLYGLLRERGYSCSGMPRADGSFEILVEPL